MLRYWRPLLTKMLVGLVSSGNSRICFLLSRKLLLTPGSPYHFQLGDTKLHSLSPSLSGFLSLCQFPTICPCETQLSWSPQVSRPSFFDLEAELAAVKSLLNVAFSLEYSLSCYGKCLTSSLLHHDLETKNTTKF